MCVALSIIPVVFVGEFNKHDTFFYFVRIMSFAHANFNNWIQQSRIIG